MLWTYLVTCSTRCTTRTPCKLQPCLKPSISLLLFARSGPCCVGGPYSDSRPLAGQFKTRRGVAALDYAFPWNVSDVQNGMTGGHKITYRQCNTLPALLKRLLGLLDFPRENPTGKCVSMSALHRKADFSQMRIRKMKSTSHACRRPNSLREIYMEANMIST